MSRASEVDRLLDEAVRVGIDGLADEFSDWWAARDPRAGELVDRLAASHDDEVYRDLLLELIQRTGLARPAIRRLLIDAHDVADVEQSVLAVVALRGGGWDGRARFTTWLHRVAENEAKMFIRARDRRPSTAVADPVPEPFLARLSTLVADRDVVDRAMATLPGDLREPLVLREVDGLDYDEIAERLGVPLGTVRSRLHRARERLVTELRAQLG